MRWILWTLTLAVALSGCAAAPEAQTPKEDETLLRINGQEIPAWRYFCWLDRELAGLEEPPSEAEVEGLKDRALADTVLYAAVESMAAEYGLTLTAEETAALTPGVWTGETQWRALAAVGALYGKLCAMEIPEETLAAFAQKEGYRTVDRILIPAGDGAADAAAQIFARLNGGGEAAFLAEKGGRTDERRTFRPGEGVFSPALEEAAATLKEGQLSGILESEEGFSILYCLKTDLSEILIPWVDSCLLARAGSSRAEALPVYETMDISGRIQRIFNENVRISPRSSSS